MSEDDAAPAAKEAAPVADGASLDAPLPREEGSKTLVQIKDVGGAFVLGSPKAMTFEELVKAACQPPMIGTSEEEVTDATSSQHPLEEVDAAPRKNSIPSSGATSELGRPISKEDWFSSEGAVYRPPASSRSQGHLMYDVWFSSPAIGLTLSFKEHVFVQGMTGVAALKLGLIAKGDIILSAACKQGWTRCTGSLARLTDFIRTNGRPIVLRFWRRPEPLDLNDVVRTPSSSAIFLEFLKRYLDSPNYKEVVKNEKRLASTLENENSDYAKMRRLLRRTQSADARSFDAEELTDVDEDEEEEEVEHAETLPVTKRSTSQYVNTPIALFNFLLEVAKIQRQVAATSQNRQTQVIVQGSVLQGIVPKYLKLSGDYSIVDVLSSDPKSRRALREVLATGALLALDQLYSYIYTLLRNDAFALFLHEQDVEKALEKLGETNGWLLRVYSDMVRTFVPLEVTLYSERGFMVFLLFILSLSESNQIEQRDAVLPYATLWALRSQNSNPFATSIAGIIKDKMDFVDPDDQSIREAHLKSKLLSSCPMLNQTFLKSELGRFVSEAFAASILPSNGGTHANMDNHFPRLSMMLNTAKLPDHLSLHRSMQAESRAPSSAEGESVAEGREVSSGKVRDQDWDLTQCFIFHLKKGATEFRILAQFANDPASKQVEPFFLPQGTAHDDLESCSYPMLFSFVMGGGFYGATLVCERDDNGGRVGICALSLQPCMLELRSFVASFFSNHEAMLVRDLFNHEKIGEALENCIQKPQELRDMEEIEGMELQVLFEAFSCEEVIRLFESCLLERKILLVSRRYSALTFICEAIKSILSPLEWSHVYAPILPRRMLGHLECPTPFIIGIHKDYAFKRDFPFLLDAVVVDLDIGTVQLPTVSGSTSQIGPGVPPPDAEIPFSLRGQLLEQLHALTRPALAACDRLDGLLPSSFKARFPTKEIKEAFQATIHALLDRAPQCCVPVPFPGDSITVFDEKAFDAYWEPSQLPFITSMMRSQAVSSYLAQVTLSATPPTLGTDEPSA